MASPLFITSRDNPLLKELRKLAQDNAAYRKTGRYWIEGDHLCSAALQRGLKPAILVTSESFGPGAQVEYALAAIKTIVIPDTLFRDISGLESPAGVGFVLDLPVERLELLATAREPTDQSFVPAPDRSPRLA